LEKLGLDGASSPSNPVWLHSFSELGRTPNAPNPASFMGQADVHEARTEPIDKTPQDTAITATIVLEIW
jgi:hypothetical protein